MNKEIYQKVKNGEIDMYTLDNDTLEKIGRMLDEEMKIKKAYIENKIKKAN